MRDSDYSYSELAFCQKKSEALLQSSPSLEYVYKSKADFGLVIATSDWAIANFTTVIFKQGFAIELPVIIDVVAIVVVNAN
jgi:hypothetical protein